MTDRQKVYTKVQQALKPLCKGMKEGHYVTLSMMVAGLVLGKKANLSKMSAEIPHKSKDASIEKRMARFTRNQNNDGKAIFLPFAQQILTRLSHLQMFFSIDGSAIGRGCMALVVGVIYKKRALPICWLVYEGKKGHTTVERHIQILESLRLSVSKDADVRILGDGEFDGTALLDWVEQEAGWRFVMRTCKNGLLSLGEKTFHYQDLALCRGCRFFLGSVGFTGKKAGPYNAVAWWGAEYKEPIYLVTNIDDLDDCCNAYRKRFAIETFFSDQKSRGFGMDKSHISDPERLSRLFLAACIGFLWMVHLGLEVIERGETGWIDRTERIDKSIFRLGMDWLKRCLKFGLPISIGFSVPHAKSVR